MGRPRKSPSMTDGKREIISRLIEEYDIYTIDLFDNPPDLSIKLPTYVVNLIC